MKYGFGLFLIAFVLSVFSLNSFATVKYPRDVKTEFEKVHYCLSQLNSGLSKDESELSSDFDLFAEREANKRNFSFINYPTVEFQKKYSRLNDRDCSRLEIMSELRENIPLMVRKDFELKLQKPRSEISLFSQEKKVSAGKLLEPYVDLDSACVSASHKEMLGIYNFPEVVAYVTDVLKKEGNIDVATIVKLSEKEYEFPKVVVNEFIKACDIIKRNSVYKKLLSDSYPKSPKNVQLPCGWIVSGINVQDWTQGDGNYSKIVGEAENNSSNSHQWFVAKIYSRSYEPMDQKRFSLETPQGKSEIFKVEVTGFHADSIGAITIDCQ